jgi:hypothetical protein
MRLTSLYLLDNISSFPSPWFEHAGDDIPADHRPFPALLSHPRRSACGKWPRRPPAATLRPRRRSPSPPVSLPVAASSQCSRSLCRRAGEEDFPRYRFG